MLMASSQACGVMALSLAINGENSMMGMAMHLAMRRNG